MGFSQSLTAVKEKSEHFAVHNRCHQVAGFISAAGNGSAQITGASAGGGDVPLYAIIGEISFTNAQVVQAPSLRFSNDRIQVLNSNFTSAKNMLLFWYDAK